MHDLKARKKPQTGSFPDFLLIMWFLMATALRRNPKSFRPTRACFATQFKLNPGTGTLSTACLTACKARQMPRHKGKAYPRLGLNVT
jgi:hypothetical protein